MVFLSSACKRCLVASHFSLLMEPNEQLLPRNSRMAKTQLEVDGSPQKRELVEDAKDRVSDLIIV